MRATDRTDRSITTYQAQSRQRIALPIGVNCKFTAHFTLYLLQLLILKRWHLIFYIITIESIFFQSISKFSRCLLDSSIVSLVSSSLWVPALDTSLQSPVTVCVSFAGLHKRVRVAARAELHRHRRHRVLQPEHQPLARSVRPPAICLVNWRTMRAQFGVLSVQVHLSASAVARLTAAGSFVHTALRLSLARRLHRWAHCIIFSLIIRSVYEYLHTRLLVLYVLMLFETSSIQYINSCNVLSVQYSYTHTSMDKYNIFNLQLKTDTLNFFYAGYLMTFGLEFIIVNTERQVCFGLKTIALVHCGVFLLAVEHRTFISRTLMQMREMVAASPSLERLSQSACARLVLWPLKKVLFLYAVGVALVCFNFLRFELYWKVRQARSLLV